jgi:hypothetical protein
VIALFHHQHAAFFRENFGGALPVLRRSQQPVQDHQRWRTLAIFTEKEIKSIIQAFELSIDN